jgi:hypothetical protein
MSAATEDLLAQITQLEALILENKRDRKDTLAQEEQLLGLKARLSYMNEELKKNDRILKG